MIERRMHDVLLFFFLFWTPRHRKLRLLLWAIRGSPQSARFEGASSSRGFCSWAYICTSLLLNSTPSSSWPLTLLQSMWLSTSLFRLIPLEFDHVRPIWSWLEFGQILSIIAIRVRCFLLGRSWSKLSKYRRLWPFVRPYVGHFSHRKNGMSSRLDTSLACQSIYMFLLIFT